MLRLSPKPKTILEVMNVQVYLKEFYSADISIWPILWYCGCERDKKEKLYGRKEEKAILTFKSMYSLT